LADVHVSGGWPPVVPLDAPLVAEPLLMDPVLALPVVDIPLVEAPLDIAPLVVMPLLETPLAEVPLAAMPLLETPLDVVPLPAKPALDDPLAEELPAEDAPLDPVELVVPDELPDLNSAPPHPTSAGTTVDAVTTMKTRASSDDLMHPRRATDVPGLRDCVPSRFEHLSCANLRQDDSRVMGSGNHVSLCARPEPKAAYRRCGMSSSL
jgi:hypothetical protein